MDDSLPESIDDNKIVEERTNVVALQFIAAKWGRLYNSWIQPDRNGNHSLQRNWPGFDHFLHRLSESLIRGPYRNHEQRSY